MAFRSALVIGLVWSAWPTVAAALGPAEASQGGAPVAYAPAVPVTLPPPTTVASPAATTAPTTSPLATVASAPTLAAPPATDAAPVPEATPSTAASSPAPPLTAVVSAPVPVVRAHCDTGAVIDAINGDRAAAGVGPLCADSGLAALAQAWADHLAASGQLAHQDLAAAFGFLPFGMLGENVLAGPPSQSAAQMEAAWMASPRHAENCVRAGFTAAGVGIAYGGGRVSVVVDFGG